jgi:hypothetical protein
MAKIDLEFVARQVERVITDIAALKDDMMVVLARLDRIDATAQSVVVEVRAMHSRHERLTRRVERFEERARPDASFATGALRISAGSAPRPRSGSRW